MSNSPPCPFSRNQFVKNIQSSSYNGLANYTTSLRLNLKPKPKPNPKPKLKSKLKPKP